MLKKDAWGSEVEHVEAVRNDSANCENTSLGRVGVERGIILEWILKVLVFDKKNIWLGTTGSGWVVWNTV
jgi:hypothetical protein